MSTQLCRANWGVQSKGWLFPAVLNGDLGCGLHCCRNSEQKIGTGRSTPGFSLTPAAGKTKTQGQNSSKKLKEKTQPLGSTLLRFVKLKKKTHLLDKFSGLPLNMPFLLPNIFNKGKILEMFWFIFQKSRKKHVLRSKFSKTQGKNSKTQGKNPKLKEKTQPLGFSILALDPN